MAASGAGKPPELAVFPDSTGNTAGQGSTPAHQQSSAKHEVKPDKSWSPQPWYFGTQTHSWKRRTHDHDLKWHIPWTKSCFANGRVLIIDYISNDLIAASSAGGKRQVAVAAQEFQTLKSLKAFYADKERAHSAALRVVHVQNARWATDYLLKKFNIDNPSEMVGMSGFSKWAKYTGPIQRNGKPFPNGRSWREQTDPWRGVSRTAFGLDYLKVFTTPDPKKARSQSVFGDKPLDARMMHLDAYPDDSDNSFGYDVSVQRMNVYVQRNLGPPGQVSAEDQPKNPYAKHMPDGKWAKSDDEKVQLNYLDNSTSIIIFETSASMLMEDCLVQPRNELENRWRRLSFYLRKDVIGNDARVAAQCANMILGDIFHGLAIVWQEFLAASANHVNLLEDKIYDNPADESRAPELFTNQAAWLKVDKVMYIHQDLVKEMQGHLRDLASVQVNDDPDLQLEQVEWLSNTPAEYERLAHSVQEDLVQPTANLSDLMYKSVGIRDSRQSLQLGLSMWRLSWVTFIFLPLTVVVGFFGMNVDIFGGSDGQAYPNVGWYFLAAVILMIIVLMLWFFVKHSLQQRRQTPYERGLYDQLFNRLEEEYPLMWTRDGAVEDVEPVSFTDRVKWRLLKRWFAPEKTINKKLYQSLSPGEDDTELGTWSRCKRYLLIQWLPQIRLRRRTGDDVPMDENVSASAPASLRYEPATIIELAKMSTPIAMADAEPTAVQQTSTVGVTAPDEQRRQSSFESERGRRHSDERPSSRGSSGVMFEERYLSESEGDGGDGTTPKETKEGAAQERVLQ